TIMPMLRADVAIGAISVLRLSPGHLSDRQLALLRTFADQAVIAIENVRLFNETKEALEQQRAVGDVLKTISHSVFDLQPVLDAVVENAARLCDAEAVWMTRVDGDAVIVPALARYGVDSDGRPLST